MKVIADLMNLVFISVYGAKKGMERDGLGAGEELSSENMNYFYDSFINRLSKMHSTYGKVIYCGEGKHSTALRKKIYPNYKAGRKKGNQESKNCIFDNFGKIEEIVSYFPSKLIVVEGAEADDSMYSLAKYYADLGEDVTVLTSDGDLSQLTLLNKKITVISNSTNKVIVPDPNIIKYKAIVGDTSDSISGIPGIGKKTFAKMMEDENLFKKKMEGKEELYESLLSIVDLERYPQKYHEEALKLCLETKWNNLEEDSVTKFMIDNNVLGAAMRYWPYNVSKINLACMDDEIEYFSDFEEKFSSETDNSDCDEDIDKLLEEIKKL